MASRHQVSGQQLAQWLQWELAQNALLTACSPPGGSAGWGLALMSTIGRPWVQQLSELVPGQQRPACCYEALLSAQDLCFCDTAPPHHKEAGFLAGTVTPVWARSVQGEPGSAQRPTACLGVEPGTRGGTHSREAGTQRTAHERGTITTCQGRALWVGLGAQDTRVPVVLTEGRVCVQRLSLHQQSQLILDTPSEGSLGPQRAPPAPGWDRMAQHDQEPATTRPAGPLSTAAVCKFQVVDWGIWWWAHGCSMAHSHNLSRFKIPSESSYQQQKNRKQKPFEVRSSKKQRRAPNPSPRE